MVARDDAVIGCTGELLIGTRGPGRARRGPGPGQGRHRGLPRLVRRAAAEGRDRARGGLARHAARWTSSSGPTRWTPRPAEPRTPTEGEASDVRLSRTRTRRGDADLGRPPRTGRRALPGGHRARQVRAAGLPQDPVPDARDVRGGGRRDLRDPAGHRADRARPSSPSRSATTTRASSTPASASCPTRTRCRS